MNGKSKWALVSGASSGIGAELARVAAADGHDIIITARRKERLDALAEELRAGGRQVHVVVGDLADPKTPERIYRSVENLGLSVDLLVNNAGFGDCHLFQDARAEKLSEMITVNVSSLVALTRLFLPQLLSQPRAAILNVASVAGFQPGPGMAVYYATKAFVLSFSEALAEELRKTAVKVSALCPGPTRSEFGVAANAQSSLIFQKRFLADTREVASYGYRAAIKGKPVAIYGFGFKVLVQLQRILPRRFTAFLTGKLQATRRS